ncbi:AraC-like DNA-binding protein [Novosphingobium kunmingense]|uniref:AraC-like DNA-binding protein n=1 Tax=Novosphingobium kunmingense TaxID=1211806 RepID=A0A2N0H4U9_9SPHN|nr:helix-turn-helix domain-containing protein [Novosphingobium kunmingense]PKB13958.1 AraC-like DNA-binding protein [Novosphingobium kunmingense]
MIVTLVASGDPALEPWILGYAATELESGRRVERRVVPARPNCFLQVNLAGNQTIVDIESGERIATPSVCLFGPLGHYRYDMECANGYRSFRIRLQPASAGRLFGVDPLALADRFQPISLPDGLLEALHAAAPDYPAMAALCDRWIAGLVAGGLSECEVARAARVVRERRGQVGIGSLHDSSGLSMRHFQRRFKALTGQNPKHYARVCRVAHAVWMKECNADLPWTAIAVDVGYADQSHFIRDFKALTGMIPRNFVRHLPQFTALRVAAPATVHA